MRHFYWIIISILILINYSCKEINTTPDPLNKIEYNIEIKILDKNHLGIPNVTVGVKIQEFPLNIINLVTNSNGVTKEFKVTDGIYYIGTAIYNNIYYEIKREFSPFDLLINRYEVNLYDYTKERIVQFNIIKNKLTPIVGRKVALLYDNKFDQTTDFNILYSKKIFETITDSTGTVIFSNISNIHHDKYGILLYENSNDYKLFSFPNGYYYNDTTFINFYK